MKTGENAGLFRRAAAAAGGAPLWRLEAGGSGGLLLAVRGSSRQLDSSRRKLARALVSSRAPR